MKVLPLTLCLSLLSSGIGFKSHAALASSAQSSNLQGLAVCANPMISCNRSYKTFAPYELGLHLPSTIKPNRDYKSMPFYGVVLKVASVGVEQICDGGEFSTQWEKERKRVQGWFSQRKVFANHQCPDMAAVSYIVDGRNNNLAFIAVYGGATSKEASLVLAKMKRIYKGARLQRMQVVFQQIVQ